MTKVANIHNRPKQLPDLSTAMLGKLPPQAIDLEEAVLGACLVERTALEDVLEIVGASDIFYQERHAKIFDCMRTMVDSGRQVDLLTVTQELRGRDELEAVGGAFYLTQLLNKVVTTAHTEDHTRIVLEKYILREVIRVAGSALGQAYGAGADCFEVLESAEKGLYDVASLGIRKNVAKVGSVVAEMMRRLQVNITSKIDFTGVQTGFSGLNALTGGWQRPDLIIVAARPSVGKSAFTINTALASAMDLLYGGGAAIFNLEMGDVSIVERMVAAVSGVTLDHIKRPQRLLPGELERISAAATRIAHLPIYIDDTAGLTLSELRSKARRLKRKHDIKVIVLDYLQLMESGNAESRNPGNREQEISKISRGLKKLAKDLDIPIIALSQMNRQIDTANREPQLSDLRESGAIEQDADVVMFLWRASDKMLAEKPYLRGKVLCSVKKHRNGALDEFVFNAENEIQRWTEYEGEDFQSFLPTKMPKPYPTESGGSQGDLPF